MPNITTTLYLSDEVYKSKFLPRKTEILDKMRISIREELGVEVREKK
jgi:hypothetical protein